MGLWEGREGEFKAPIREQIDSPQAVALHRAQRAEVMARRNMDFKFEHCDLEELWEDGSVMLTRHEFSSADFVMLEFAELELLYRAAKRVRDERS